MRHRYNSKHTRMHYACNRCRRWNLPTTAAHTPQQASKQASSNACTSLWVSSPPCLATAESDTCTVTHRKAHRESLHICTQHYSTTRSRVMCAFEEKDGECMSPPLQQERMKHTHTHNATHRLSTKVVDALTLQLSQAATNEHSTACHATHSCSSIDDSTFHHRSSEHTTM